MLIQKLVSLIFLLWFGWAAGEEVLIASGEWPPYSGAALPRNGTVMAQLSDAFAAAGIQVRYEFVPWNRALELTRAGKYAVTPMWIKTPERERDFYVVGPVAASVSVLFHREDRPMDWQQLSDLKPLRIGVSLGYSYGPVLDKMLAEGQLQADSAPTDEQNLRKLAKGRIDIFPLDRDVGNFLIATSNDPSLKALTFNPKPIHTEPLYLLISRKVPEGEALARRFAAIWPKYRPLGVPLQ